MSYKSLHKTLLLILSFVLLLAPVRGNDCLPNHGTKIAPVPLNAKEIRLTIQYPAGLRQKGVQGTVKTRILVDKTGRVERVVILESPHTEMTLECVLKLKKLIFVPGQEDGEAILCWVDFQIDFKLPRA